MFFLPGIKPPLGQPPGLAKHFYRLILPAVFCQQVPDLLFSLRPLTQGILLPFLFHERALTSRKARLTPNPKKTTGRIITHLAKWYNEQFGIRYDLALDFITQDLLRKLANPALRERDKRTGEYVDPWRQYNSALLNIEKIAAAAFRISIDNKGFRLHSVLSTLRGILRNCLVYNNLELVSIDICNSQPYLIIYSLALVVLLSL